MRVIMRQLPRMCTECRLLNHRPVTASGASWSSVETGQSSDRSPLTLDPSFSFLSSSWTDRSATPGRRLPIRRELGASGPPSR
jgi:hypothetical protein